MEGILHLVVDLSCLYTSQVVQLFFHEQYSCLHIIYTFLHQEGQSPYFLPQSLCSFFRGSKGAMATPCVATSALVVVAYHWVFKPHGNCCGWYNFSNFIVSFHCTTQFFEGQRGNSRARNFRRGLILFYTLCSLFFFPFLDLFLCCCFLCKTPYIISFPAKLLFRSLRELTR